MSKFSIFVNGRRHDISFAVVGHRDVVRLAFDPPPSDPRIAFTVTYRNGPRQNVKGILTDELLVVANAMAFNVAITTNA